MDEILLFESSGSMEYFPDPDTVVEDITNELPEEVSADSEEDPVDKLEEDSEEKFEEVPEEKLEEGPEEKLEEEPEEQLKEEGKKNDVFQVSNVQTDIYPSDDLERLSDNQIVVVSENIINKPLNEYTVSESLQLYIFISIFVAGFIVLVRRAVIKWS